MTEVFIYDAVRTPRGRGKKNGALHEVKPIDLLRTCLNALAARNHFDPSQTDDVVVGCVSPTGDQGYNIAKAALLYANWPERVPGLQINRYCASGLEAVCWAALKIQAGRGNCIIAGGVESMSRQPMGSDGGALLFDPEVIHRTLHVPQGISADLMATLEGFTRMELDTWALLSQQRAINAWQSGWFQRSIVPVYDRNSLLIADKDEHLREGLTLQDLERLPPAFESIGNEGFDEFALRKYPMVEKIQHLHTAGNSSGIVDGAALILVGSREFGEHSGIKPRALVRSFATVSTEPVLMLNGAVPAARAAIYQAGMKVQDIDLWEMNEAFAAPVLKFQRDLGIPTERLNVNGGAIAMGHPLGATGAMLLGILIDEIERRNMNTGLVALCAGGGMGTAMIIERV